MKFAFNNIKNINTNYIPFKLNYGYDLETFYNKNINLYLLFKVVNKLAIRLINLMTIYK